MLLIIHIIAAISGLIASSFSLAAPTASRIRFSFGLVVLTIVSGSAIVIQKHLGLVSACISGLLYAGFTFFLLAAARQKVVRQENP